jgi:predicted ferric reductase
VTLAVRAAFWVIAYLGAVLSPLVFAAIGGSQPDHGFWTNFSVALGFTGLAMLGLEFVLVARFRPVALPFGQDALLQFHRQIGYVGLAFILIHFGISAKWNELTLDKALHAPLLVWFGMAALFALIVLIVSSVWRRRLRLSYEAWHVIHSVLAALLIVGALLHIFFVNEYVSSLWKQILWGVISVAFRLATCGDDPAGVADHGADRHRLRRVRRGPGPVKPRAPIGSGTPFLRACDPGRPDPPPGRRRRACRA